MRRWPPQNETQFTVGEHYAHLFGAPCFDPGKDIVVPGYKPLNVYRQSPLLGQPAQTRDILLFLRGDVGKTREPQYSNGVRQGVYAAAQAGNWSSLYNIQISGRDDIEGDYSTLLALSLFCLVAGGASSRPAACAAMPRNGVTSLRPGPLLVQETAMQCGQKTRCCTAASRCSSWTTSCPFWARSWTGHHSACAWPSGMCNASRRCCTLLSPQDARGCGYATLNSPFVMNYAWGGRAMHCVALTAICNPMLSSARCRRGASVGLCGVLIDVGLQELQANVAKVWNRFAYSSHFPFDQDIDMARQAGQRAWKDAGEPEHKSHPAPAWDRPPDDAFGTLMQILYGRATGAARRRWGGLAQLREELVADTE